MPRAPRSLAPSPLITVSVVSHADGAPLNALLQSLVHYEQPRRLQLIVTDNLGHDLPELQLPKGYSLTMVRNERPQGYARNHNAAFKLAQGRYFCVVNPDVLFVESVFFTLMESIESGAGDIAAPLIVDSAGSIQDSFRSLPSPWQLLQRRFQSLQPAPAAALGKGILYPDWIAGIFMLLRRETFARMNGLDARYRLYFEDVDFCTRARLMGLRNFVDPRVRVQHDARRASHRSVPYLFWHLQSSLRFFTSAVYWRARRLPRRLETRA